MLLVLSNTILIVSTRTRDLSVPRLGRNPSSELAEFALKIRIGAYAPFRKKGMENYV